MGKKEQKIYQIDLCEFFRYKHVAYFNVKVTLTKLFMYNLYIPVANDMSYR